MKLFFLILMMVVSVGFVNALELGSEDIVGVAVDQPTLPTFNNATAVVNVSDWWDNLDTPADINAGDITDDGTYVQVIGDSMSGDLIINADFFTNGEVEIYTGGTSATDQMRFGADATNYVSFQPLAVFGDSLLWNIDGNDDGQGFLGLVVGDNSALQISNGLFRMYNVNGQAPYTLSIDDSDTSITVGEVIGRIRSRGTDSSIRDGAYIEFEGEAVWGSNVNDAPTSIRFYTQSDGNTNNLGTAKAVFWDDGTFSFGGETMSPSREFYLIGDIIATQGFYVDSTEAILDGGAGIMQITSLFQTDFAIFGSVESSMTSNHWTMNNGAIDTGFGWETDGELFIFIGDATIPTDHKVTFTNRTIEPVVDLDIDLGTSALRFGNLYVQNITADSVTGTTSEKTWAFASKTTGASALSYTGGFYDFEGTSNDFNPAVTIGSANGPYGAHVSFICAAGGAGGTDTVLNVSGVGITSSSARNASYWELVTLDDAGALDDYYETSGKYLGITNIVVLSGPDLLCNYGFSKYWDNNNKNFTVTGVDVTWTAGGSDANVDITLIHHKSTGWTYNAGAEPTPPTLVSLATDYVNENDITNGESGAWKRTSLSTAINGGGSEGTIIEIDGANSAFRIGNFVMTIKNV